VVTNYPFVEKLLEKMNDYTHKEPKYIFEFIKDGQLVDSFTENQLNAGAFTMPPKEKYDFFIFSYYSGSTGSCVQKAIHTNPTKDTFSSTPSPVKFIFTEIKLINSGGMDKIITINLVTKNYNFLVRNNAFDSDFIRYFMKKYHQIDIYNPTTGNLQNYSIKIVDSNVQIKTMDHNERMLLIDDEYVIKPLTLHTPSSL
jgi:hypothetical protein